MRAHLVPAMAVLLLLASPAGVRANVSGAVQLQAQGAWNTSPGASLGTSSTLLQESLSLHWSGLPFGPTAALLTLGGQFSNSHGSGVGTLQSRRASVDASLGLFPRRSYPLRLYARADVLNDVDGPALLTAGPSLLWGAVANLAGGGMLPAIMLNYEELRTTPVLEGAGGTLDDLRRQTSAVLSRSFGDGQLRLALSDTSDNRSTFGTTSQRSAELNWTAPGHQTYLSASRSAQSVVDLLGIQSQRQLSAGHSHVLSERVSANVDGRAGDASSGQALGRQASGSFNLNYRPFLKHSLQLSTGANAGLVRTTSPLARSETRNYGGQARAGYGRVLGPVSASLNAGVTTNQSDGPPGTSGLSTSVDTGLGLASATLQRAQLQADYVLTQVFAPISRGGERVEHRAQASATLALLRASQLGLSFGYSDGQRETLNILLGEVYRQRERALSGTLNYSTLLGPVATSAQFSHARGSVVIPSTLFVAGRPPSARATTNAALDARMPLLDGAASADARLLGSWTDLTDTQPLATYAASMGLNYAFGLFTASVNYQYTRTHGSGNFTAQHMVQSTLSRPFSF